MAPMGLKAQGPRGMALGARNLATHRDERLGLGGRPSVPGVRRFVFANQLKAIPVPIATKLRVLISQVALSVIVISSYS